MIFSYWLCGRVEQPIYIWTHLFNERTEMKENKTLPETGFVRLPVVLHHIPVSKTTWWNGVKSGRFPASVKLSAGVTTWRVEDIRALIKKIQVNQQP